MDNKNHGATITTENGTKVNVFFVDDKASKDFKSLLLEIMQQGNVKESLDSMFYESLDIPIKETKEEVSSNESDSYESIDDTLPTDIANPTTVNDSLENDSLQDEDEGTKEPFQSEISWHEFTEVEDAIILNEENSIEDLAVLIEVSESDIRDRRAFLKYKSKTKTNETPTINTRNAPTDHWEEVLKTLTTLELNVIKDNKNTTDSAAELLGRSHNDILALRNLLHVKSKRAKTGNEKERRSYSKKELSLIKDMSLSDKECAEKIGRTTRAVGSKRHKMGLK